MKLKPRFKQLMAQCALLRTALIRLGALQRPSRTNQGVRERARWQHGAKLHDGYAAAGGGACEGIGGLGVPMMLCEAVMSNWLKQPLFDGKRLFLLLMVIQGAAFSTAIPAQVVETKATNFKLADWVYQKPPKDIPLRVGIIPPEALVPPITPNVTKQFLVCNRIWLDQGGSYEQPFAVTYASDNKVSEKEFFNGIFALDSYFFNARNDWGRLEPNKGYLKGRDSIFNAGSEAVLLIDYDHPSSQGHRYFSLYVKRLNELPCAGLKRSQCKRFEASAELYEFEKVVGFPSSYLRKVELGKVHIDSRCVGQQYLYHREPFLEKSSWFERFLNTLRND